MCSDDSKDHSAAACRLNLLEQEPRDVTLAQSGAEVSSEDQKGFDINKTVCRSEDAIKKMDIPIRKPSPIMHIPTPNRRRAPVPAASSTADLLLVGGVAMPMTPTSQASQPVQLGPTPWEISTTAHSGQQEGSSYRDQLRVSGQQALQRARDHGLMPRASGSNSGASTPSSGGPMPLSIFGALSTQHAQSASVLGVQFGFAPTVGVPQQQHYPCPHPTFFQPQAYFQPQRACFQSQPQQAFIVAHVPQLIGYQASGPMIQPQVPCHEQRCTPQAPSPTTRFDLNKEQMAEMLRHASEDVYED